MPDQFLSWLSYWSARPLPPDTTYGAMGAMMGVSFVVGLMMRSGAGMARGAGRYYSKGINRVKGLKR